MCSLTLSKVLPGVLLSYSSERSEQNSGIVEVSVEDLLRVLYYLKTSSTEQYKLLTDLTALDLGSLGYQVVYNLLSVKYNKRLLLKVSLTGGVESLPSITGLYKSGNWLEREVWDMFGILFEGNEDLRRLLTDYGFSGHPLRKSYPLSGYLECRYDESKKRVIYEPLSLSQTSKTWWCG